MKQAQSYGELLNSMVAQEQEQRQQQQEPQQNQLVARALNLNPELKQAQGPGADTAFGSNGDVQALLKLLTATAQNGPPTGGVSSSQSDAGTAAALNAALAVISQTLGPGAANLAASASQGLPSGTSLPPVLPSTPVSERSPPGSSPAHTQAPGNTELVQLAVALQQHHDHQQQEQLKRQQQHLQQQISLLHRVQQQQQQQLSGTKRTRLDAGLLDSFAQDHLRAKELQNAILLNSSYGQSHAGPAQRGLSMLEKNFPADRKGFPMSHRADEYASRARGIPAEYLQRGASFPAPMPVLPAPAPKKKKAKTGSMQAKWWPNRTELVFQDITKKYAKDEKPAEAEDKGEQHEELKLGSPSPKEKKILDPAASKTTESSESKIKESGLSSPGNSGSTAVSADISVCDASTNEGSKASKPAEESNEKKGDLERPPKAQDKDAERADKASLAPPTLQRDMKGNLILRGIYKKPEGTFKADIQVHGRSVYLGNYARIELACQAYDRVLIKIHGADNIKNFALPASQRLHFDLRYYEDDLSYIEKVRSHASSLDTNPGWQSELALCYRDRWSI